MQFVICLLGVTVWMLGILSTAIIWGWLVSDDDQRLEAAGVFICFLAVFCFSTAYLIFSHGGFRP